MKRAEAGFSLLELLTVIATMGVLSGISMQTYKTYRTSAYDSHTVQMKMQTIDALEAGMVELSEDTLDGGYWVGSQPDGTFWGWHWDVNGGNALNGDTLVPGLKANTNVRITAAHETWCNNGNVVSWGFNTSDFACIVDSITTRHCKGSYETMWMRWNNGSVMEMEWLNPGC